MKTELSIAWRYLFAKKSHNIINVISAISSAGLAIGTAALVIILSVYNGFSKIVSDNLADIDPDIRVEASAGQSFVPDSLIASLQVIDNIRSISRSLEFSIFAECDGNQTVALLKGADEVFEAESGIEKHIAAGSAALRKGDLDLAVMGAGIARKTGANPRFIQNIRLYYPDRQKKLSTISPADNLRSAEVFPGGIFSINAELDEKLIAVPFDVAEELYGEGEVTSLGIWLNDNSVKSAGESIKRIEEKAGKGFIVLDRFGQHRELYKMMQLEKAAVFLILVLIVFIVAFNIFGCLSMLMIEKKEDIGTFRAMGADEKMIRRIFLLEGWLISILGMAVGLIAGIVLSLLQQEFGIVRMPGNFLVSAYPVVMQWKDIALAATSVTFVGFIIARTVSGMRLKD